MADENNKQFAIQKLYVKDISFESPNSPLIFMEKWEPKVDFQLNSGAQPLQEHLYEVSLTVTVTVKLEDKTAYLVEVCQAGIFTLAGFSEEELGPMLGIFCLNALYPYAREAVSDLVVRGGFPALLLAPVNFEGLYAQHLQQQTSSAVN
jgi:preprotein translocase subunit SecB